MSHMFADTLDELHAMADRLKLRREWFQRGSRLAHYDVSVSKRALAISYGAVEVGPQWVAERIREVVNKKSGCA